MGAFPTVHSHLFSLFWVHQKDTGDGARECIAGVVGKESSFAVDDRLRGAAVVDCDDGDAEGHRLDTVEAGLVDAVHMHTYAYIMFICLYVYIYCCRCIRSSIRGGSSSEFCGGLKETNLSLS